MHGAETWTEKSAASDRRDYRVHAARRGARRRQCAGLRVRCLGSGQKVFFCRYRARDGALREFNLGEVGPLTLAKARHAASRKRLEREQGKDPQLDKRKERAQAEREGLLTAHRAWLEGRAPQVGYSARNPYQEPRAQRGLAGGYGTVRDAVRPLRTDAGAALLTQCRFETDLGEQAQADWGEVRVRLCATRCSSENGILYFPYCD